LYLKIVFFVQKWAFYTPKYPIILAQKLHKVHPMIHRENFRWQCKERGVCSVHELDLLFDISRTLSKAKSLEQIVAPTLEMIAQHLNMERGMLLIYNRTRSELLVEHAFGLSSKEMSRGVYKLGEGIIGKVLAQGKPIIVPSIENEPEFLNKTKSRNAEQRKNHSFICVPIRYENEIIGVLSADRHCEKHECTAEDIRLFSLIGTLIAGRVRNRQEELEEIERLTAENQKLQSQIEHQAQPKGIIGNSKAMRRVFGMVNRVARSNSTVLIRGESGVGKELVASAIHNNSARSQMPFIKVNCAAIPENLVESELFGYEKGAFTGADKQHKGKFEQAHKGTIFLDEIGDLPLSVQVKLLRVLQEHQIERLGSAETIQIDVRIITATHQNLDDMVVQKKFREDLYYRINVFPVFVPPLRERKEDILALANYFVEKYNRINGLSIKRISTPAIDMMLAYHWPGNVRELENCIERAGILSTDDVISGFNLPPTLQVPESNTHAPRALLERMECVEKEMICDALKLHQGNMAKAAAHLQITERIIALRIKKYGIDLWRMKRSSTV
jgi:Nif-specific regulatory protein